MKISICSDLHLEFGDLEIANTDNADVLILGGDILVARDLELWIEDESAMLIAATSSQKGRCDRYVDFVRRCCAAFPHVIYIMGNHEHYHGDYAKSAGIIKRSFADLENFYFLDKETKLIDGVLFYGGTMWTDFNGEDPDTMHKIKFMMNDFNVVKNSDRMTSFQVTVTDPDRPDQTMTKFKERVSAFSPEDALEDHKQFLRGLLSTLERNPYTPTVVVGHHAPSRNSTHPRYQNERVMNGAYSSYLDDIMMSHRQIRLWTHGHTHEDFDYMIQTCRVVCNPRGYDGYEARADNFRLVTVEVKNEGTTA